VGAHKSDSISRVILLTIVRREKQTFEPVKIMLRAGRTDATVYPRGEPANTVRLLVMIQRVSSEFISCDVTLIIIAGEANAREAFLLSRPSAQHVSVESFSRLKLD
jgi:hypothetical protein